MPGSAPLLNHHAADVKLKNCTSARLQVRVFCFGNAKLKPARLFKGFFEIDLT